MDRDRLSRRFWVGHVRLEGIFRGAADYDSYASETLLLRVTIAISSSCERRIWIAAGVTDLRRALNFLPKRKAEFMEPMDDGLLPRLETAGRPPMALRIKLDGYPPSP